MYRKHIRKIKNISERATRVNLIGASSALPQTAAETSMVEEQMHMVKCNRSSAYRIG